MSAVPGPAPVVEPVGPAARLVRGAGIAYTEVGDTGVLVDPATRTVYALTPTAVALWSSLDGRPLVQVLDAHGVASTDAGYRSIVELLRRLKASGLVTDLGVDASPADAPGLPEAVAPAVEVRVAVERAPSAADGTFDGIADAVVLVLGVPGAARSAVTIELDHHTEPVGVRVEGRAVAAVRFDPDLHEVAASPHGSAVDVVVAFSCWVRAVQDPAALAQPAVIDALAAIAERPDFTRIEPAPSP